MKFGMNILKFGRRIFRSIREKDIHVKKESEEGKLGRK